MSESRELLCDTANSLFPKLAAERDFEACWRLVEEAGFPLLLVPEAAGGFGGDWGDAFAVLRLAGLHCLALPLGEAIVANAALAKADGSAPETLVGIASHVEGDWDEGLFSGVLHDVGWGRHTDKVLAQYRGQTLLFDTALAQTGERMTIAGEPRASMTFVRVPARVLAGSDVRHGGAFVRVAQSAGALDAALAMAIDYVNSRNQFGRPLSKLQAVQQNLAIAASEAAAVNTAGQAAAFALDAGDGSFETAAAKLRTNRAIGVVTSIVHQVHGAIGFTEEYALHPLTRRLMSWRGEFGGDASLSLEIGRAVAALGAKDFWADMTRRSDRIAV